MRCLLVLGGVVCQLGTFLDMFHGFGLGLGGGFEFNRGCGAKGIAVVSDVEQRRDESNHTKDSEELDKRFSHITV